ncbi:uncharacterized protein LOC144293967 isoform X1 [Canis aureus]
MRDRQLQFLSQASSDGFALFQSPQSTCKTCSVSGFAAVQSEKMAIYEVGRRPTLHTKSSMLSSWTFPPPELMLAAAFWTPAVCFRNRINREQTNPQLPVCTVLWFLSGATDSSRSTR